MKRFLIPLLLLAASVLSGYLFLRYSLLCQELDGLFLRTPDYFRWALARPFPVAQVLSDWMTQFYRLAAWGPWLLGLQVLCAYGLLKGILPSRYELTPALGACGEWLVIAFSATAKPGVAVLLILFVLWLVSRFFRREKEAPVAMQRILSALAVGACFLVVALAPGIRRTERWARVKSGIVFRKPETVLKAATPAYVESDPELAPFALLALGDQGALGDHLFDYPVHEENDFDMCDEEDYYNSLLYRAFLYDRLACPDEVAHNLFQLGTQQRHGTSFLVLRQLVTEYFLQGDYGLVEKYLKILDRSSAHQAYTASFRRLMAEGSPREKDTPLTRGEAPLITRNPLYNLMQLSLRGTSSDFAVDRLLCTLLLQRDLPRFATAFEAASSSPRFSSRIPKAYQEALLLYGQMSDAPSAGSVISQQTENRFRRFMVQMNEGTDLSVQQADFGNTFWFYYYYAGSE